MGHEILLGIFLTILIATVLNIILEKIKVSPIIGYIVTGAIIAYIFNINNLDTHSLDLLAEFGIVFLMFTIGLEMNLKKIRTMKEILFVNGFLQVASCAIIIFIFAKFVFNLNTISSVIISLSFSLSSTAVVLTYLKNSKDIYTKYGENSVGILIFQDLAAIPILLLVSILANNDASIGYILGKTFLFAILIILFVFTIGKKIITLLLHFAANTKMEELFLSAVFTVVIGMSLLAHEIGFTYSLGAFLTGMVISDTKYRIKVESDIISYKDLLLGTFFFTVGAKIDFVTFVNDFHYIALVFCLILFLKSLVIYFIIRRKSNKNVSAKTAIALCQIGEFSFAILTLASSYSLIDNRLLNFLMSITVLSMIVTPFIINNIYRLASNFQAEFYESDNIKPITEENHVIICGYSVLGRAISKKLSEKNIPFVIISNNIKHVLLARKMGHAGYFGHLNKKSVQESLKVEKSLAVVLTLNDINEKQLISEELLKYYPKVNIVLKILNLEEKEQLKNLNIKKYIYSYWEIGKLFTEEILNIKKER